MIEDIIMLSIILMILSWLFEGKLIPQTILLFMSIIILIDYVITTTYLESHVGECMILATIIIYSGLQAIYGEKE